MIIALVNVLLTAGATFTSARTRGRCPAGLKVALWAAATVALSSLMLSLAEAFNLLDASLLVTIATTLSWCLTAIACVWFAVWDYFRKVNGPHSGT